MSDEYAVFILTHGRADRVLTLHTLRRQGYTGPVHLVVDDEDADEPEYRRRYGDQVIVFDKEAVAQTFDEADNFQDRRSVVYARNACYRIAEDLGLEYFFELDDDYTNFRYKFASDFTYCDRGIKNLDRLFRIILDFYKSIPVLILAMGQGGDFIGGERGDTASRLWLKRKAMNFLVCSTTRPVQFIGRINEDVNTYVLRGHRGGLFLTFFNAVLKQVPTQQNTGGMVDLYQSVGTYIKTFYTVMMAPSCVRAGINPPMGEQRVHHIVNWNAAIPKLLREECRKSATQPRRE